MILSDFGKKLAGPSGINQLMDDLGKPFPEGIRIVQMGGGNPARIPEIEKMYRSRMEEILSCGEEFENLIGRYDAPQGKTAFLDQVASYFSKTYGWKITRENVAVSNGSQSAFFYLFNMFAGISEGKKRKIVFPLVPEYVGYADQCVENDMFVGIPSSFEFFPDHTFKYHVDFNLLEKYLSSHDDVAGLCVTRPTNPTGNVLTDDEVSHLSKLSKKYDIPLFLDNAYGLPWPNIIWDNVNPYWDENVVLSMSLSKIGLPSLRTGIIIARKEIIDALSKINAIAALASGSVGQSLAGPLIESGKLIEAAKNCVKPYYQKKAIKTQALIHKYFDGTNYAVHVSEGSIFMWLYLPELKISTIEFYNRLKEKGVFVMPGEYFFFGNDKSLPKIEEHPHFSKCLRLNYAGNEDDVDYGISLIAQEYKNC